MSTVTPCTCSSATARCNAGLLHRRLGGNLVAHQADRVRPRPDEDKAGALGLFGEVSVLRQEPVSGVDRLRVGDLRRGDDRRDIEVAAGRRRGPDAHRFVGETHVLRVPVRFRVHDDRPDPEFAAGALHAQRDLAPVRDQHLAEELIRILGDDRRRRCAQRQGPTSSAGVSRCGPAAGRTRPAGRFRPGFP